MRGTDTWFWALKGQARREWRKECFFRQWYNYRTLYSVTAMDTLCAVVLADLEEEYGPSPDPLIVNPTVDLTIDPGWPYTVDNYRDRREGPKLGPYRRKPVHHPARHQHLDVAEAEALAEAREAGR